MVEQHRRVEPRHIVGTGMATDPERIDRIQHDADRRERDTREQPVEGFSDVLGRAPPRGDLADEPQARPSSTNAADRQGASSSTATGSSPVKRRLERATLRAPDPRAKQLHAQLNKASKVDGIVPTTTTHADDKPRADTPRPPVTGAPRS
jgi:hypothetical protein